MPSHLNPSYYHFLEFTRRCNIITFSICNLSSTQVALASEAIISVQAALAAVSIFVMVISPSAKVAFSFSVAIPALYTFKILYYSHRHKLPLINHDRFLVFASQLEQLI